MSTLSLQRPGTPAAAPASMAHCLALAALLHLWLVLLLGNAPAGTAQPGQGVGGAINVTLRGDEPARAVPAVPPVPSLPSIGPVGAAAEPRWGGVVRDAARPTNETAGAARLGRWAPTPQPTEARPAHGEHTVAQPPGPPPPPGRVLQDRSVGLAEPTADSTPSRSGPVEALRAEPAPAPPPPAAAPAAAVPAPASPTTATLPSRLPPAAAGAALRALGDVAAPAALSVPSLAAPPLPVALPERLPAPAAAEATATALPPSPPVLPTAPSAPATPAAQPAPTVRQMGPAATAAAVRQAPLQRIESAVTTAPDLPALTVPSAALRAPDAGATVGHDVATTPSQPASAPRLNLDLPRLRGGELSRAQTTGVLQLLPRPPELPDKLGKEIEKAARADCRTAYSGLGVLAVVPLAADAVRKDGCKW